jgi:hypothetical protein
LVIYELATFNNGWLWQAVDDKRLRSKVFAGCRIGSFFICPHFIIQISSVLNHNYYGLNRLAKTIEEHLEFLLACWKFRALDDF